ncbi:unnamed protein product, partial [Staurois parvus]
MSWQSAPAESSVSYQCDSTPTFQLVYILSGYNHIPKDKHTRN